MCVLPFTYNLLAGPLSKVSKADWKFASDQLELVELGKSVRADSKKLQEIFLDIRAITDVSSDAVGNIANGLANQSIKTSQLILFYQSSFLQLPISITEPEKVNYFEQTIKVISYSISNLDTNIQFLLYIYSTIESNAILMKIDNSRDIIKDSIKKLNTASIMLESMQHYCETTAPKDRPKLEWNREGQKSPTK